MKKSKLIVEYDYDFELAGIVSTARGYKMAWEINHKLGIHLIKQPDLVVGFKNQTEKQFSYYAFETRLNRLKLFKNKPVDYTEGNYFLVPEFPRFDFIILTASEEPEYFTIVMNLLKELPSIELITSLPTDSLRSKSNFIF
jgi:hypothetical protein